MGIDEIIQEINKLSILEIVELKDKLQEEWGVEAALPAAVAAMPAGEGGGAAEEEKVLFTAKISEIGEDKIQVIKAVRELTTLGLKEAKELVESAPDAIVAEDVSKEDADSIKEKLEATGATVVLE